MYELIGTAEWQTVLLYAGVGFFAICALIIWQRKRGKPWEEFHIVGLFAEKIDGNWQISQTKFQSFGAFVISSIGVVVCVIRGEIPAEFVGLLTIYGGLYIFGRLGAQKVSTEADVQIRRAEINRGRRGDVDPEVEDPEPAYSGKERRKKRLLE